MRDACVVLVNTEWNIGIINALTDGARHALEQAGVKEIIVITVPGAVEIPFAIRRFYEGAARKPDAFIAIGCVIRGDTPHFEYVCETVSDGVLQLNLSLPVPVIFGVLTVNTDEQAQERIGGKHGHKGEEAGVTAVKMIALNRSFDQAPG